MSKFEFIARSFFETSPQTLFQWHEDSGFAVLLNLDPRIKILKKPNSLFVGETAEFEIPILPGIYRKWIAKHTAYAPPHRFEDTQIEGPFLQFIHSHEFASSRNGSILTDRIQIQFYPIPFSGLVLGFLLKNQFRDRHRATAKAMGVSYQEELFQLRKI